MAILLCYFQYLLYSSEADQIYIYIYIWIVSWVVNGHWICAQQKSIWIVLCTIHMYIYILRPTKIDMDSHMHNIYIYILCIGLFISIFVGRKFSDHWLLNVQLKFDLRCLLNTYILSYNFAWFTDVMFHRKQVDGHFSWSRKHVAKFWVRVSIH